MPTAEKTKLHIMEADTIKGLPPDFLDFLTESPEQGLKQSQVEEKPFIRSSVIQRNCQLNSQLQLEEREEGPSHSFLEGFTRQNLNPAEGEVFNPKEKRKILQSLLECSSCKVGFKTGKERESHGKER